MVDLAGLTISDRLRQSLLSSKSGGMAWYSFTVSLLFVFPIADEVKFLIRQTSTDT